MRSQRLARATVVAVATCIASGSAAASNLFSEILKRAPIPVDVVIPDLLERSTAAINSVHHERSCEARRADFEGILDLAGLVAERADLAYNEPPKGDSIISVGGTLSGRWGFFATRLDPSLKGYSLPATFLPPPGWNSGDINPVTIISFRGTDDLFDWWANYTQARRGWTPDQYRFALEMSAAALDSIPEDHLVIFAGHSLGGSLATYVALAATYGKTPYFQGKARRGVGAITFNSAGLHPDNFAAVVPDMSSLYPANISNIHHFLSYSKDRRVDVVGAFSFAGYALLPGAKYLIDRNDVTLGSWPSAQKITELHDIKALRSEIVNRGGDQTG